MTTGNPACRWGAFDADECSLMRERSVAGRSDQIPSCPAHPGDLCSCGHLGYDGHDMRSSPPACLSCACGADPCDGCQRSIGLCGLQGIRTDEGGDVPPSRICSDCLGTIHHLNPERAAYLIDCAEIGALHACIEWAVPAKAQTPANHWIDCSLCGAVLEEAGDALIAP